MQPDLDQLLYAYNTN